MISSVYWSFTLVVWAGTGYSATRISFYKEYYSSQIFLSLFRARKLELTTGRPEPGNSGYSRDWQLGYQVPDSREGGKFEF